VGAAGTPAACASSATVAHSHAANVAEASRDGRTRELIMGVILNRRFE
jgi:hypothetical protein